MKAKHRHELKTNELAEWLAHLPQWTKKNLRTIIYASVLTILVGGSAFFYLHRKNVEGVRKQLELTSLIAQFPQNKVRILQEYTKGRDISYSLIQMAGGLQTIAKNATDDAHSALALIKRGDALRTELHYRLGDISTEEIAKQLDKAQASYNEAFIKAKGNRTLLAAAKFGQGICEEERSNFDEAKQIYSQLAEASDFEGTIAAAQAKYRLSTMDNYREILVFKQSPTKVQPQISQPGPAPLSPTVFQSQSATPQAKTNSDSPKKNEIVSSDTNLPIE